MISADKGGARVFFDLSTLDPGAVSAFLREWSSGRSAKTFGLCHWIVSSSKARSIAESNDEGAVYLKSRLEAGDRLVFANPSGLDWSYLYPSEAQRELDSIRSEWGDDAWTFLTNTSRALAWTSTVSGKFFLPTAQGLFRFVDGRKTFFPWSKTSGTSVHWIAAGSALLVQLPPAPWTGFDSVSASRTAEIVADPFLPSEKIAALKASAWRKGRDVSPSLSPFFSVNSEFPGLGDKDAVDFDEALSGIRKRALVANMQGVTDLNEGALKLRFLNGSLVSIVRSHDLRPLCTGIRSYVQWKGKKHAFVTNSAFSFEGDFSWGMRQSLVLNHEDLLEAGRVIVDTFFVEDSPELTISLTVRWPVWKLETTVERWAALELDVPAPSRFDALTCKSLWPDFRSTDVLVPRSAKHGVFAGCDFAFSCAKTSLVVGFPQNQSPRPHLLPWAWTKSGGNLRFSLNPEGSYGPTSSANLAGVEEHFSIYLNASDGAKLPFTVTRKQATELIPPFVLPAHS